LCTRGASDHTRLPPPAGTVPDQLVQLALLQPAGSDSTSAALLPRALDLSGNALQGEMPEWLVPLVPAAVRSCRWAWE
jgi:hypothetical protein